MDFKAVLRFLRKFVKFIKWLEEQSKGLPPHLIDAPHDDWEWPMSLIPRAWTSFTGPNYPQPPELYYGDSGHPGENGDRKPIPMPGHWFYGAVLYKGEIPLPYIAITTKGGWHARFGFRWDDIDGYYAFPDFTIKDISSEFP